MSCVECEGAEGVESEGARVHVHKGMQSVRVSWLDRNQQEKTPQADSLKIQTKASGQTDWHQSKPHRRT